jgi:hypothetical protein
MLPETKQPAAQILTDRDLALQKSILAARKGTLDWYVSLQAPNEPAGVSRISAAHDPKRWPGMLLPGTYNAVMGRALIGGPDAFSPDQKKSLVAWLESHRRDDGVFLIKGMRDDTVFKKSDLRETWNYIHFHVTNYSLGAIDMLDRDAAPRLSFAQPYLEPLALKAWLAERDLRDPWLEGNNIVNLGSFLLLMHCQGTAEIRRQVDVALGILFDWHDRLQEPATGFWGIGQLSDPLRALHAMAGSMHNFHLWYATGRRLPYQDKAVDFALAQPPVIDSACIDVDLVDLLVHASWQIDHRRAETLQWLRALLPKLLAFQNADGGFPDVRSGIGIPPRSQDGWIGGYAEPQGLSNTFSTWFRWIAIAMCAQCLWPQWRPFNNTGWHFRRMVGIGYCANSS